MAVVVVLLIRPSRCARKAPLP